MRVENHKLIIPIFGDNKEMLEPEEFNLLMPSESVEAVNLLLGVIKDLVEELEESDRENYLKCSN